MTINIKSPEKSDTAKERSQKVVWFAQDVYKAHLDKVQTLDDQLLLVNFLRDIANKVDPAQGIIKIHDLLADDLGDQGPLMLGQIEPRWARIEETEP